MQWRFGRIVLNCIMCLSVWSPGGPTSPQVPRVNRLPWLPGCTELLRSASPPERNKSVAWPDTGEAGCLGKLVVANPCGHRPYQSDEAPPGPIHRYAGCSNCGSTCADSPYPPTVDDNLVKLASAVVCCCHVCLICHVTYKYLQYNLVTNGSET